MAGLWALIFSFYKSCEGYDDGSFWGGFLSWKTILIAWSPVMLIAVIMGILGFLSEED